MGFFLFYYILFYFILFYVSVICNIRNTNRECVHVFSLR